MIHRFRNLSTDHQGPPKHCQ